MSTTGMPKELTRGYSTAFQDMLATAPPKVLSVKDLEDLDDAEFSAKIARSEPQNPIKSEDEAA